MKNIKKWGLKRLSMSCAVAFLIVPNIGVKAEEVAPSSPPSEGVYQFGELLLDVKNRTLSFPAEVNMSDGFVEYVLVNTKGKLHESVFVTDSTASELHVAMLLLKSKGQGSLISGLPLELEVEWKDEDGKVNNCSLLEVIDLAGGDPRKSANEALPKNTWRYSSAVLERNGAVHLANEGSLIALMTDPAALVNNVWVQQDPLNGVGGRTQSSSSDAAQRSVHGSQSVKAGKLPKKGTPVRIIFKIYKYQAPSKKK